MVSAAAALVVSARAMVIAAATTLSAVAHNLDRFRSEAVTDGIRTLLDGRRHRGRPSKNLCIRTGQAPTLTSTGPSVATRATCAVSRCLLELRLNASHKLLVGPLPTIVGGGRASWSRELGVERRRSCG